MRDLEEFARRGLRDRPLLRPGARRGAHGALLRRPPDSSACTPRFEDGDDRRRRRRVPVRADRSRAASFRRAGVTVVGVLPTHRRRGVLRAMMRAQLDDVHERGEPIALLWASEETIYGRFGYGMASRRARDRASAGVLGVRAAVRARGHAPARRRRRGARALPARLGRVRRGTPGMFARTRNWWELRILFEPPERRDEGGPKRFVVLELDGRPEGYALYRLKPKWENGVSNRSSRSIEAIALDGRPTAELWRYLLDIDWAAGSPPGCCPSTTRCSSSSRRRGACATGSPTGSGCGSSTSARRCRARGYAADGAVVFDVIDEFCPWNGDAGGSRRPSEADDGVGAAPLDVAALGSRLPRRLHVLRARARRPGRGAAARRRRSSGRDVRVRPRALVPRDLLRHSSQGATIADPGRLAQLGEHQLDKLGVTGSSPVPPTPAIPLQERRLRRFEPRIKGRWSV